LLFTIELGARPSQFSHNDNSGESLTVILLPWQPQFYYETTFFILRDWITGNGIARQSRWQPPNLTRCVKGARWSLADA